MARRARARPGAGAAAPEVVVQEAHLQVQGVRRAAVQRPTQVGHDLAARHLVAVAHQHHVPPARVLVQDVLRRVQPLVRLAPPAQPRAPARQLRPACEGARRVGSAGCAPVTGPHAGWVGHPVGLHKVCGRRVKSSTGPSTMQRVARREKERQRAALDCTARYAEAGLSRGRAMPWRRSPRVCCPCA
jgi:hypothetical protein